MLVLPVACGTGDEAAFTTASTIDTTVGSGTTAETNVAETGSGSVFPSGGELLVSFTYEPSSAAQAKRPYVAVWVEDSAGNLVDTVSLWFEQGEGEKWLSDLRQWHSASGGSDTTMSGATRVAGDYTVTWDGTDTNGDAVAQGDYVLFVEAAREHGDYSFTSGTITIGDDGTTITLGDDGELSGISAELAV